MPKERFPFFGELLFEGRCSNEGSSFFPGTYIVFQLDDMKDETSKILLIFRGDKEL